MKKQISIFFAALTLLAIKTHCAAVLPPEAAFAQDLIMLLDVDNQENPTDEGSWPGTLTFCVALLQKAAPIVVSPSLWHNVVTRAGIFAASPMLKAFQATPEKTLATIYDYSISSPQNFICYATYTQFSGEFKRNEWVVKNIENIAYILIPTTYLNKKKSQNIIIPMKSNTETIFNCYGKNGTILAKKGELLNITKQELLTGLKFDHYEDVVNPLTPKSNMNNKKQVTNDQTAAMAKFQWPELFVTRKDLGLMAPPTINKPMPGKKREPTPYELYQNKLLDRYKKETADQGATLEVFEQYMFPWFIYLTGHGSPGEGGSIANLTVPQFRDFIAFLNTSIKTMFFFYDSCYAGGQHTDPTFKFAEKVPLNLNFTIGVGALTDQPTLGAYLQISSPTAIPLYNFTMQITEPILVDGVLLTTLSTANFKAFFDELKKHFMIKLDKKTINDLRKPLADIINLIHNFKKLSIRNTPLIRYPNTEWFKATDINNEVNIIDRRVILNYEEKRIQSFEVNKKTLLVYESYIPVEVIITYKESGWSKDLSIIPMKTNQEIYFFENIKKQEPTTLSDIFKSFTPFPSIPDRQTLYIKKLTITLKDNANILGELGGAQYKNKEIILENIIITQVLADITLSFKFKTNYYEAELRFKDYNALNPLIKPLTDLTKINKNDQAFSAIATVYPWKFRQGLGASVESAKGAPITQQRVVSLREEYDKQKKLGAAKLQSWKETLPMLQRKIVDTFDAQVPSKQKKSTPSTPELLQALNSLSSALNNLKGAVRQ